MVVGRGSPEPQGVTITLSTVLSDSRLLIDTELASYQLNYSALAATELKDSILRIQCKVAGKYCISVRKGTVTE